MKRILEELQYPPLIPSLRHSVAPSSLPFVRSSVDSFSSYSIIFISRISFYPYSISLVALAERKNIFSFFFKCKKKKKSKLNIRWYNDVYTDILQHILFSSFQFLIRKDNISIRNVISFFSSIIIFHSHSTWSPDVSILLLHLHHHPWHCSRIELCACKAEG